MIDGCPLYSSLRLEAIGFRLEAMAFRLEVLGWNKRMDLNFLPFIRPRAPLLDRSSVYYYTDYVARWPSREEFHSSILGLWGLLQYGRRTSSHSRRPCQKESLGRLVGQRSFRMVDCALREVLPLDDAPVTKALAKETHVRPRPTTEFGRFCGAAHSFSLGL